MTKEKMGHTFDCIRGHIHSFNFHSTQYYVCPPTKYLPIMLSVRNKKMSET